jgi:hypothetical protein
MKINAFWIVFLCVLWVPILAPLIFDEFVEMVERLTGEPISNLFKRKE